MRRIGFWCLRRLVLAPLMPILGVIAVVVWVLVAALSVLIDPAVSLLYRRHPRWRVLRVVTFAVCYFLGETVCLLCCLAVWLASGFGVRIGRPRAVRAHEFLLRQFLRGLVWASGWIFGFHLLVTEPDRHPLDVRRAEGVAPILVLARHAGPGASFALVELLMSRYHRRVKVVLKEQLRLDPSVDVLLTRTGCTWLPARRLREGEAAGRVGDAAAALAPHDALVLFPEGADWTPVRHLEAVARLRGRGLVQQARAALRMPHVLPPRPAGTLAALQGAPDADVFVFTHTGHDRLLDFASTWAALPLRLPLHMTWWREAASGVPRDSEDAVGDWLQQSWADIDAWIDEQQNLDELRAAD
jgi:hypothetical protein